MQQSGKILFYNPDEGVGIIITKQKAKFAFDVAEWDDYDTLPAAGMEVVFVPDGERAVTVMGAGKVPAAETAAEAPPETGQDFDPDAPLPTSIRLVVTPSEAIRDYFDGIERQIRERTQYQNAGGRLDFLRIRRFLFTTYNNLTELDVHFITPELKAMRDDLLQMSQVYDDYKIKATYPDVALDRVFLSRQGDYVYLREEAEYCFSELKRLHATEQLLAETIAEKEEVLNRTLRSSAQFLRLDEEFKGIKTNYVDTVHMIATLDERFKTASRLMKEFEKEHRGTFLEQFTEASRKYRKQILYILDAQAFMFDDLLWRQAKKSKVIKHFFQEAHIQGDYCAKTYLKYYLNTLDPELLSPEQQELFDLYDYLESLEHDTILVLVHDIDDALRLKYLLARTDASMTVEAFVDERKALAWAKEKQPSLLIVEDQLQSFSFVPFMNAYKKKVSLRPKIVLLSNLDPERFDEEGIERVLRKGFSDKEMTGAVTEILVKDEDG
jgi:hypothetical protein